MRSELIKNVALSTVTTKRGTVPVWNISGFYGDYTISVKDAETQHVAEMKYIKWGVKKSEQTMRNIHGFDHSHSCFHEAAPRMVDKCNKYGKKGSLTKI